MTLDPMTLTVTSRATPSLPPDAHLTIAGQGMSTSDSLDTAQTIAGYGDATTQVNNLKALSPAKQAQAWQQASSDQQNLWLQGGYPHPAQHRGFFSRVAHDVLGAPSALVHQAGRIAPIGAAENAIGRDLIHPVGQAIGTAGNALGAGLRFEQHLARTGQMMDITHAGWNSSEFADAWHRTTNGDTTFDPHKDRDIQQTSGLDADTIALAKAVAASDSELNKFVADKRAQGMSDDDLAGLVNKMNDPNFKDVVTQYKDSKLSFGRSLVPSWVWQHAHWLGTGISGAGDLAFSFLDPTLAAGKAAKAVKLARYSIKSPEEIDAVLAKPAAQRWLNEVSGSLAEGDYAGLLNRHSELANVIAPAAQSGIKSAAELRTSLTPEAMREGMQASGLADATTADKLGDWMKGNIMAAHILSGGGSSVSHGVAMVPTLSLTGKAFLDTKDVLRNKIEWGSDFGVNVGEDGAISRTGDPISGTIRLMGTTAKRLTTLIPQGASFTPDAADSIVTVQRFARAYLPAAAADKIVNAWALAPDLAAKRVTYMEMLGQTFKAAGVDMSDDSSIMKHFVDNIERGLVRQKYSSGGNDLMDAGGGLTEANGILEHQLTANWSLPSFKDLSAAANRGRFMQMVYGTANNPLAQGFSSIWKPLQLLRVGFPIRVGIEEMSGALSREGLSKIAQATLARNITPGGVNLVPPLEGLNPFEKGVSRLMRGLPEGARAKISSLGDLQAMTLAQRAHDGMRNAVGHLPGVGAMADTLREYQPDLDRSLFSEISSSEGRMLGFSNDEQDAAEAVQTGVSKEALNLTPRMKVKPNGEYQEYTGGEPGFMSAWMKNLDDLAGSGLARHVMQNVGLDDTSLRGKVADYLQSPDFAQNWQKAARSRRLRDGRTVGIDATARQAAEDWADVAIHHVKSLTHAPGTDGEEFGAPIDGLTSQLLNTKSASDLKGLMGIDKELRPNAVSGPEFVPFVAGDVGGLLRHWVDNGFEHIGHAIDHISRQPMTLVALHKADTTLRPITEGLFGAGTEMEQEIRHELVRQRTFREVLPYIHNPKIRSQMNVLTQNLAPFQFAQEQFWKRWARTFYHSPEALREAQLAHHALGASGITHKDDQGNEIFSYPLTGFAQKAVTDGLELLGTPASLPVSQMFTGQLKMVAPGLDRTFMPSFGPLVSGTLNELTRHFHELQPVEQTLLGPQGADRPIWENIVPSSIARFVNASIANDATSPSYANAQMRAIQDMYATGHVPDNGVDPQTGEKLPMTSEQRQTFMRRTANWTRTNMFLRALIGFNVPAAPQSAIGDTKIGQELRLLAQSGMTYTQAIQALMKKDPDAYPYTVFMSAAAGKEPLPSTKDAASALENNRDFFHAYAKSGGFLLPAHSSDQKFDDFAYKDQLLEEMRKRMSPSEFLDQIQYAQAAPDYYDTRDAYNARVKNLHGAARDRESNNYQAWKQQYLYDHPIFAEKLQSATSVVERGQTLQELGRALDDPRAPQNAQTSAIRDLIDTYGAYKANVGKWAGMNSKMAHNARQRETSNFVNWAKNSFLKANPDAVDAYNGLIRPEVEPEA